MKEKLKKFWYYSLDSGQLFWFILWMLIPLVIFACIAICVLFPFIFEFWMMGVCFAVIVALLKKI